MISLCTVQSNESSSTSDCRINQPGPGENDIYVVRSDKFHLELNSRAVSSPRYTIPGKLARVRGGSRRVTHGNKLATLLTTVRADICDGKLWANVARKRERDSEQKQSSEWRKRSSGGEWRRCIAERRKRGGCRWARADCVLRARRRKGNAFYLRIISFVSRILIRPAISKQHHWHRPSTSSSPSFLNAALVRANVPRCNGHALIALRKHEFPPAKYITKLIAPRRNCRGPRIHFAGAQVQAS